MASPQKSANFIIVNVLLFGRNLVRVAIPRQIKLTELIQGILDSDAYDLQPEIYAMSKLYGLLNLKYRVLRQVVPIQTISGPPFPEVYPDTRDGRPSLFTTQCHAGIPDDGSCLNLIVEEPPSIFDLRQTGPFRFQSREIAAYLNKHDIEYILGDQRVSDF
jgi:hypothetical protein